MFGIVLCIGQFSILHGLLYAVLTGMDKARNVSFAIFIFQFPAAMLACFGLDAALRGKIPLQLLTRIGFASLGFSAILYLFLIGRFTFEPDVAKYQTGVPLAALYALLFGSIFLLWVHGRIAHQTLGYWLVGLLLFELGNVTQALYPSREEGWKQLDGLTRNGDLVQFMKDHLGDGRYDVSEAVLPNNLGDWDEIDQYDGYTGVTVNIMSMAFNVNSRRLYGVRYWVSDKPRNEGETPIFVSETGLKIYSEPPSFPRAWSVKKVQVAKQELIPQLIIGSTPDSLRDTAFISVDKPSLENLRRRRHDFLPQGARHELHRGGGYAMQAHGDRRQHLLPGMDGPGGRPADQNV